MLKIQNVTNTVNYEFNGVKIKGNQIGLSNKQICVINPLDYGYGIHNNLCPTHWIKTFNTTNQIVSISEGLVIQYEIKRQSPKQMILLKSATIVNNLGISIPSKIQLKRLKSN